MWGWPIGLDGMGGRERAPYYHYYLIKGLDEELAGAIDERFCESYKRWKIDHPDARTKKQVSLATRINY